MKPRTVLVGGVSSGIGEALARLLVGQGARVLGISRSAPPTAGIEWCSADISNEHATRAAVADLLSDVERLDALVCNAGLGLIGSVEETPNEAARALFATNYFGTVSLIRDCLPRLRAARGRLVLIGSLAGKVPLPFQGHYAASKAALASFAFSLRNELVESGVLVSLVEPGEVATQFNAKAERHSDPSSHYSTAFARCCAAIDRDSRGAIAPGRVADLVVRVLNDRSPRARYAIGPSANWVGLANRLLPDWIKLWLIRRHFQL